MREVVIIGVGMTKFGKFPDISLRELGSKAIWTAVKDSNVPPKDIQVAYFGNSLAGLITGQEGVRGQTVLRYAGFGGIPIINVENACASGTTALRGAWLEVASGACDVALAIGAEKLFCNDTPRSVKAMASNSEIELSALGFQFSAGYAMTLRKYMEKYGATKEHFAKVAVKNSYNGSLNPFAQYQKPLSIEEVLNSRMVADPLTLLMCSSMADGAAAAILTSKDKAKKYTTKPLVEIAACILRSGKFRLPDDTSPESATLAAMDAYTQAGIGPKDIDVAEVHDAMSPTELYRYEQLGFCKEGEAPRLIDEGRTKINGDLPVNPSGGLCARGHPVGATGIAQITELVWQLRGEAGPRQVNNPKVALSQNSGGHVEGDNAAATVTILKKL
jgi:acetyl-CoA acyltransferase